MEKSQRFIKQILLDDLKKNLTVKLNDYFNVCIVLPSKRIIHVSSTVNYDVARSTAKNISSNNDIETIVTRPYDLYFKGEFFKSMNFDNVIERFVEKLPF